MNISRDLNKLKNRKIEYNVNAITERINKR